MINTKNANTPVWQTIYTYSELPKDLQPLESLAYNLRWSWDPEVRTLFESIDAELWHSSEGNPVKFIRNLSGKRIDEITADKGLMQRIGEAYNNLQTYLNEPADTARPSVAYFCMEYGLTHVLKIYSGGLGILAGDYIKEASDSNVRMTAVGLLYRYGYFRQRLSGDGSQVAEYEAQDFNLLPIVQLLNPDGSPFVLEVPYPNQTVYCHVGRIDVGRVSIYLLDTDNERNSEWDRQITHKLYGGDWENRLRQEYLLGIGGILLLEKLGIREEVYHMNEGHGAFINLQRIVQYVEQEGMGIDLALEIVRASSLYTCHTPVPAGHDYFDEELLGKYLGSFPARLGISWHDLLNLGRENPDSSEKFSMSVFALNTCQEANGVSKLHGAVSQRMFASVWKGFLPEELNVGYVTNGVHLPTWAAPAWQKVFADSLGDDYLIHQADEERWERLLSLPDERIYEIRMGLKRRFVDHVRKHYREIWLKADLDPQMVIDTLEKLDERTLFIGFGRRFATYKRAHLLFTDLNRLRQIIDNPKCPVCFFFTGKAHPADGGGQGLIKHIIEISRRPEFLGKIIFLDDYDMHLARILIPGVDVWLNTPTRPLEASGTSGQKAEMNGVLNLSVLDGWWYEGYREGAGWALTDKRTFANQTFQDKLDAATVYDLVENQVAPLYYDQNAAGYSTGWIEMIKQSFVKIAPRFTMRRMLNDYFERFYNKLAHRSAKLRSDGNAPARNIVAWKDDVARKWHELQVLDFHTCRSTEATQHINIVGDKISINVTVDRGSLSADLCCELLIVDNVTDDFDKLGLVAPFKNLGIEGTRQTFTLELEMPKPGSHRVAVRLTPYNPDLPHRMDFSYVRWLDIASMTPK